MAEGCFRLGSTPIERASLKRAAKFLAARAKALDIPLKNRSACLSMNKLSLEWGRMSADGRGLNSLPAARSACGTFQPTFKPRYGGAAPRVQRRVSRSRRIAALHSRIGFSPSRRPQAHPRNHSRTTIEAGRLMAGGNDRATRPPRSEVEKAALLRQTEELLLQKDVLLQEIQHRVANSLQIIAGILMMKARLVTSAETREHLEDAHRRVMSVATVQQHISEAGRVNLIEIRPCLVNLCESLAASMIGDRAAIALKVHSDDSTVLSAYAVSLGLIVTELVINALKHAFPKDPPNAGVLVSYETSGSTWSLVVSDNGVGKPAETAPPRKGGLGTSLVTALAQQLDAQVESVNSPTGFKISIAGATVSTKLPHAA